MNESTRPLQLNVRLTPEEQAKLEECKIKLRIWQTSRIVKQALKEFFEKILK